MTWLLFLDESGHDHRLLPFEIRGGVAIGVGKLWSFIQNWQRLELETFGVRLADYRKEAKGMKLLGKDRFRWAAQLPPFDGGERRKHARAFLDKGLSGGKPTRPEFTAYGQACIEMARGAFDLLEAADARLFACMVPRAVQSAELRSSDFLRKDHVFLFERFYYLLEATARHGLIVMDESDKALDREFVARMQSYFTRTGVGRNRSYWIVPAPFFVSSDMALPIQAADLCLYSLNWGFRPQRWDAEIDTRAEIAREFGPKLARLQWQGEGHRNGQTYRSRGIVLVSDPFTPSENRKGGNAPHDAS